MQQSYSHSGYPYDNACIESFHSLIKREWLNRFHIINYKHAYRLVFLSILKPFIIPLGFTATVTICLLMILKNFLRDYLLCQQLSWQNFSFYFVLNLDTGPCLAKDTLDIPLYLAYSSKLMRPFWLMCFDIKKLPFNCSNFMLPLLKGIDAYFVFLNYSLGRLYQKCRNYSCSYRCLKLQNQFF